MSEKKSRGIDPTYLRTIFDQFSAGKLQSDNPNSLPEGLIGVYEELVPPRASIAERARLLKFFTPWALLRSEASIELVSSLLESSPREVSSQMTIYSKWFNSSGSGKYQLYHDRFRLYLLQRIAASELSRCNDAIIEQCEAAIQIRDGQEWERYALEHLSAHLFSNSVMNGSPKKLREYALNRSFWERQSVVSGGFYWSEALLNAMLAWVSRFNVNEVVEIVGHKLELKLLQQNASSKVIHALKANDLQTVFQRFEELGAEDRAGLERRFVMYVLCFLELAEGGNSNDAGRRDALRALLDHFEAHMPADIGRFDWNRIIPSELLCQIAFLLLEFDLDPSDLFDRGEGWSLEWIESVDELKRAQLDFLASVSTKIEGKQDKVSALKCLAKAWFKIGDSESARTTLQSAMEVANQINWKHHQQSAITQLSVELADQGHLDLARQSLESLDVVEERNKLLSGISRAYAKHRRFGEAFSFAAEMLSGKKRDAAFEVIIREMVRQGALTEAVAEVQNRLNDTDHGMYMIAIELASIGEIDEALELACEIENEQLVSFVASSIYGAMVREGRVEEAISFASNSDWTADDVRLSDPHVVAFRINQILNESGIEGAYAVAKEIEYNGLRSEAMVQVARAAAKQSVIERAKEILLEAVDLIRGSDAPTRAGCMAFLAEGLEAHGCLAESHQVLKMAASTADEIDNSSVRLIVYEHLFTALAKRGNGRQALDMLGERIGRVEALKILSSALCGPEKSGHLKDLLYHFMDRSRVRFPAAVQSRILFDIADDFLQIGRERDADLLRQKASSLGPDVEGMTRRRGMFHGIGHELAISGKLDSILDTVVRLSSNREGRSEDYADLALDIAKHGNWSLAEKLASRIPELDIQQACWFEIAQNALDQGQLSDALSSASQLMHQDSQRLFVRGILSHAPIREFDDNLALWLVPYFKKNAEILEQFILGYAVRNLFFEETRLGQFGQMEKLMDLDWAVNLRDELMTE